MSAGGYKADERALVIQCRRLTPKRKLSVFSRYNAVEYDDI